MFMLEIGHRGQRSTDALIRDICENHGNSTARKSAVAKLNKLSKTLEHRFWKWTLGKLRTQMDYQSSELCLWFSFFLKSRGLSWLGMESLAEQGIVCSDCRHVLNNWVTQQANTMNDFCRLKIDDVLNHCQIRFFLDFLFVF